MQISYTTPLRSAWRRMQAMLFRPFHLEKWLVVGLAAFVANLLHSGGGLFGWNNGFPSRYTTSPQAGHSLAGVREHLLALLDKPVVLLVIAAGLALAGIVLLACAWAAARARFVLLDNVVTGRGEFVEPWRRHGRLGRSLFLWYAAFTFTTLLPVAAAALPFAATIVAALRGDGFVPPSLPGAALGILVAVALLLVLGFVAFLTDTFVVPLMLLHDETSSRAWARFWPLLAGHPGEFVACGLFAAVVWTGVIVALVVAGIATCCIGLLLMMIPYVSSVLLLPVEVTARAYGPEFLAQYGPEWDLFAARTGSGGEPGGPLPG